MAGIFNDTPFNIVAKKGLAAKLISVFTGVVFGDTFLQEGEIAWTTDEKRFFVTDPNNNHLLIGPPVNQSVRVNSIWVSDDYDISVNGRDFAVTVNSTLGNSKPVFVNGV